MEFLEAEIKRLREYAKELEDEIRLLQCENKQLKESLRSKENER